MLFLEVDNFIFYMYWSWVFLVGFGAADVEEGELVIRLDIF